jgi:hypothetical protein
VKKPLILTRYSLLIILLLVFFAQMAFASPTQSAAFDEGYTITYGYAYLHTGDARLSRGQNPPLTNVLLTLPLLLRDDITFPIDQPAWVKGDIFGFTDEFLWQVNVDPQRIILLVRISEMLLALLLACVIYAFTRSLFDDRAALAALFLCVFDPNILAHGHISGTDLGVTFFMFSSVWLLTSSIKHNSARRAIVAGLLAGAALSSKYSAVWLAPIVLLIAICLPGLRRDWLVRIKLLLIFGVLTSSVIWATFGFSIGSIAPGGPALPAPDYWSSLEVVRNRVTLSTPAFMLGQVSATGFPLYYPFAFLIKTPLPTLILLAMGLLSLIAYRRRGDVSVWLPFALLILAAIISSLNLGYRLMLPALPFALVIAGRGASVIWNANLHRRLIRFGVSVLAIWLVLDVLSVAPQHLAYFNPLAGDRSRDYNLLVDSNLDWGQDLIALRDWQLTHQVDQLNLAYYGSARPSVYNVAATLLPSFSLNDFGPQVDGYSAYALPPGWYAISVSSLQLGLLYSRSDIYAPFRLRQPVDRVGRSFLIYHIEYPSAGVDRTVVLGPLASDLDQMTLGDQADRQLIVKWAGDDAAVLDMHGPARYIARGGEPIVGFAPDVHDALIANAQKLGNDASGNLRLFQIDARTALQSKLKSLAQGEAMIADQTMLHLPLKFDGGLTWLGYDQTAGPGNPIELVTYWRVDQPPATRLSIFAHALDQSGQIIAQRDGLNVRLDSLEPGDVIVQHFVIARMNNMASLEIGLYDLATNRRMLIDQKYDRVYLESK